MSPDEIVCRDFAELATAYLDLALPDETLELVEEHLVVCGWCREFLRQIETAAAVVAQAPEAPPPPETVRALVAAFRAYPGHGPPG